MQQEQKDLLQALYEEYQAGLRLIAFSKGIPECEVDDIVQDTFYSFMDSYKEKALEWNPAQRKAVLVRILLNRCMDYYRSQEQQMNALSIDSEDPKVEYEIMRHHLLSDISDKLVADERMLMIRKTIEDMRPSLREVAVLYMVEGRSLTEVAEILKISKAACRMRIFRIRAYMRELFGEMNQPS